VFMLADNLGYEDISWFAQAKHNRTPNLDRLAASGLTFSNWQSAAHLCSASRAALLTGQYPARTGVFPGTFRTDAASGLSPSNIRSKTIASYLKEYYGYATAIVGKWHLGHLAEYLPTKHHGFDQWLGIPFHMSGGSIDNHTCAYDTHRLQWLPLYENERIVEQPVKIDMLASRYANAASDFVHRQVANQKPFFLYMAFSHVHQLCASADHIPEQSTCQWAASAATDPDASNPTFADALTEMDWIAGQVLDAIERSGVSNETLVIFTSDNGPWLAEQACSGLKGPFTGQWHARQFCSKRLLCRKSDSYLGD
jgi:arylsulfatase A